MRKKHLRHPVPSNNWVRVSVSVRVSVRVGVGVRARISKGESTCLTEVIDDVGFVLWR